MGRPHLLGCGIFALSARAIRCDIVLECKRPKASLSEEKIPRNIPHKITKLSVSNELIHGIETSRAASEVGSPRRGPELLEFRRASLQFSLMYEADPPGRWSEKEGPSGSIPAMFLATYRGFQ